MSDGLTEVTLAPQRVDAQTEEFLQEPDYKSNELKALRDIGAIKCGIGI